MVFLRPLFISYFYPPAGGTGLPGSQRTVKFIRYLGEEVRPFVLTLEPDCYPDGLLLDFTPSLPIRNERIVRTRIQDRFLQAMALRNRLIRCGNDPPPENEPVPAASPTADGSAGSRPSLGKRCKDFIFNAYYFPDQIAAPWLQPAIRAGVRLVRSHDINVIFATGMPWTALEVGRVISRRTGIPFIADFRDPWLGNPFLESKGRLLDFREQLCEKRIVKQAGLVSANTEPLRQEFIARYPGMEKERIITLPNGFDRQDFQHLVGENDKQEREVDKLVLIHAGFLYGRRDPAPLLDALDRLVRQCPDCADLIEFHQYGGIAIDYDLRARYWMLFERNIVRLFDPVSFDECARKLAGADLLVIIQPGTKTQVPSKLYDYLCIDRPILTITPPDGALGKMIRQERFGDLFAPDEIDALADRLQEYCHQYRKGDWKKRPGYPGRERFDVRRISRFLEDQMVQLVHEKS